ncbi:integral membrane protein GPR155 [Caerostris darwini]|uniref:Integral membrane protein GPR155 n=1 Tax=Caerostris darwini TaxID=1538125 RepID=A0AAV4SG84_9ARAC|nr:integral membrane protein GPR155 [Caerostris darwini]
MYIFLFQKVCLFFARQFLQIPLNWYNQTLLEPACRIQDDPYPFDDFAPTLAQCFFIVITGYLVAKFQLLSAADLRGVNAFITYIGMPGIICMTLADADFSDLRWELIFGLFLGKLFIFVLVAGVSLRISGNVGVAGLLAIFCVHSNDLPVGNPLMSALYREYRPQMMKYLFMMPVMTMVFFIPIGTFMLEVHKSRESTNQEEPQEQSSSGVSQRCSNWFRVVSKKELMVIVQSLLKSSPVIISSLLGVILNFSFDSKMPAVIHHPIKVVAATVPGCVLSLLGFNMVRKERYLITSAVVGAAVLLTVKIFITPIVMHTITRVLTDDSKSSKMLSDFALLYGIVSPATSIFLSGQEFRKPLAAMSATLIVNSFLSFPTSFVVARFTIAPTCKLSHYVPLLKDILFWVACFSIACDIYVIISIIWRKKWNKVPYCYVLCLVITQVSTCCGILLWNLNHEHQWGVFFQMALYYGGEMSGFIWIGTIAVILLTADRHPALAQSGFTVICITTFSICAVITTVMCALILCNDIKKVFIVGRARSNFEFLQLAATTILELVCVFIVGMCLMLHFKRKHSVSLENKMQKKCVFDNPVFFLDSENVTATHYKMRRLGNQIGTRKRPSSASVLSVLSEKDEADLYYKEILHNGGQDKCSNTGREWTFRFFSLLLLLLISTLVKLISNLYKLVHSMALEIMIPLEFLQSILFVGQGFFILLTFGIDARTLSIQMTKWWRKIRYGKEEFVPKIPEVDNKSEIAQFCNQFNTYYISKCFQNLAKDRKWKENFYKNCFWGHQLVDWLIQEGVAKDDIEAEELGQNLLLGGVISHVTEAHHFHDAPYLYYFVKREEALPPEGDQHRRSLGRPGGDLAILIAQPFHSPRVATVIEPHQTNCMYLESLFCILFSKCHKTLISNCIS